MRRLNWTALSRRDLHGINGWLTDNADPEIAVDIVIRIRDRATLLIDHPFAGAVEHDVIRRLRVPRTSYLILYRVPDDRQVEILRIRHVREDRFTSDPS